MRTSMRLALLLLLGLILSACGSLEVERTTGPGSTAAGPITLYTSVTQDTVDTVVTGFQSLHPGVKVDVFRAPTGQLNARIASDLRTGRVRADVLWETDPLSTQAQESQGLLLRWTPAAAAQLPSAYRTDAFWGTRILNLVIIHKRGMKNPPTGWSELISAAYHNQVAVPDPAFAGSAFAALGYFGLSPSFGMDFYRKLRANGAVQVESIPDVVNDVAEGRYRVGIALDNSARAAIKKGSPLQVVWPSDGAIALYSPIAVFKESPHRAAAKAFVNYVLTPDAQSRIAGTGWEPILPGVNGPRPPAGATQVYPDWTQAYGRQAALLEEYRAIFGA